MHACCQIKLGGISKQAMDGGLWQREQWPGAICVRMWPGVYTVY